MATGFSGTTPLEWFPMNPVVQKMMTSPTETQPLECTLLGFDHVGHLFVQLSGSDITTPHNQRMRKVFEQVYDNCSEGNSHLKVKDIECSPGEIYAALVPDDDTYRFMRGQILEVVDTSVIMNDLDTQMKYKVKQRKLYNMVKDMFKIPLMVIKCSLKHSYRFTKGTTAVVDAAKVQSCLTTEYFLAKFYLDKKNPRTPIVELYHNPEEAKERKWSFNDDILSQILAWNGRFDIEKNMVLQNVKITHALPSGRIWIQIQSGVFEAIRKAKLTVDWTTITSTQVMKDFEDQWSSENKIFMRRDQRKPDTFIRVRLLGTLGDQSVESESTGEVLIELYDYGVKKVVHKYDLIPALYFDPALFDVPPQVLQADIINYPCGGFSPEEICKLTSEKYRKRILFKESYLGGWVCPKVEVYILKETAAREEVEKEEIQASMIIPGVECVLFPFPCSDDEIKEPGRFFDFTTDRTKLIEISDLYPTPNAQRSLLGPLKNLELN